MSYEFVVVEEAKEMETVYKKNAWMTYTEDDIISAIRFFAKRISHRKNNSDKLAELRRIINYSAQLATLLESLT